MSAHSDFGERGKSQSTLLSSRLFIWGVAAIWTALHSAAFYWTSTHNEWIGFGINCCIWVMGMVGIVGGGWFLLERQKRLERAQEALKQSKEHFRSLYEQNPVAYHSLDENGCIVYVNDAWLKMLGRQRDEVYGRSIAEFLDRSQRPLLEERFPKFKATGRVNGAEFMFRHKDGSEVVVSIEGRVLRDAEGRFVRTHCVLNDITKYRKIEHALRLTQASLVTAQRIAQLGSWVANLADLKNPSRGSLQWSDEVFRIFGHEPGAFEPTHERFYGAVHPDDVEMVRFYADRAIRNRETYQLDHRIVRPDGQVRFVREHAELVIDVSGDAIQLVGTIQDITEQKNAEATLLEKERFICGVVENSPDFIVVFDVQRHCCVYRNKEFPTSLGYSKEEMAQFDARGPFPMVHPEDHPKLFAHFQRMAQTDDGEIVTCEFRVRRRDGDYSFFMARDIVFKRDPLGQVSQVLSVAEDVTYRKKVEAERAESLARLQRERERMPIAFIQADPNFMITDWNPAAERTFGYRRDEVIGKSQIDLIVPPSARLPIEDLRRRILAGDVAAHGVQENLTKEGRTIFCEWHNTPLTKADGTFLGFLSMAVDLTERKQLEDQLRQAQKMEAVGQLAGGVAHDFNNILGAMLMQLHLLQTDSEVPASALEGLGELEKEANRAAELTRQLLSFSRRQILQIKPLDLNVVISGMLKMLRRLLREDVALEFQQGCETAWIAADEGMMQQVLMNLVVNARDAIPGTGQIVISSEALEVSQSDARSPEARSGRFVRLRVKDTGRGMDQTTLKRIFEPFFTTKEAGKGTGLGLATVYGIVKQHSGWIDVDSAPGAGSTFHLWLPAAPAATQPAPIATPEHIATVLLVEDDASVRSGVKAVLERAGIRVIEADDGRSAIRIWDEQRPNIDLVFTDMIMPGTLTGLDLARRFQAEKPGLRVILSSGYSLELAASDSLAEKLIVYLPKPCNSTLLLQTVQQCLAQRN